MKNRIINAANHPDLRPTGRRFSYWLFCANLCATDRRPMPPDFAKTAGHVLAHISHGRWSAICPYCNGGMYVSHDDPLFWCVKCRMEANGGLPMRVYFPKEYLEIENVLSMRINPATRNWTPGETVAGLARENLDHKDGLFAEGII